ncbi:MAG: aminotransferase class I/II-fold pyridoxal phosphate-dependent enzyme [Bacteriovoracaceae bacterium]|nr:pyridoxal-dependent decarboxylase [Bacteroidota bacterium]
MTEQQFQQLIESSVRSQYRFRGHWEEFDSDESMTVNHQKIHSVLSELESRLNDNFPFFHPRYAGQMLKPPHPVAVAAYLMAMQINPNNHALDGGPATAHMEMEVVQQFASMFGYQEHLGHLTSSGTIANLEALWVARSIHPAKAIACSPDAHYTHRRMCEVLQVPSIVVDVTDIKALEAEFRKGTIGTLVVTIGTTGTGSVEPLNQILPLANRYGVRIHADCAYGGFFMLLAGVEQPIIQPKPFLSLKDCDSIVIDPHKHGLQPYGCGCILFRDPGVGTVYKHDSPYTYFTSNKLHLGEISLECSRAGAAAAALWATLQCIPLSSTDGFGGILTKTREAALLWDTDISQLHGWKRYVKPDLDIVTYFNVPNTFSASSVSHQSQQVFDLAMNNGAHPLFLATMNVDSSTILQQYPDFIADTPRTKIIRSVLMKPEHKFTAHKFIQELDRIAHSA